MSFWTGTRLDEVWRLLAAQINEHVNQAHNGYLEQYLNLGYIGVAFILVIMLSGLLKIRRHLRVDPGAGMLRLCFIIVAALYNWTEASFYGLNNMWIILLLGCLEAPREKQQRVVRPRSFNQARCERGRDINRCPRACNANGEIKRRRFCPQPMLPAAPPI